MPYDYKQFRRRNLPHIQSPGAVLFVTFRLAGSIPQSVLKDWQAEEIWLAWEIDRIGKEGMSADATRNQRTRLLNFHRRWFKKFEDILHDATNGPTWLKDERLAKLVADTLHHHDGKLYRLDAYCVMSNHVHTVFKPFLTDRNLQAVPGTSPLRFESEQPPLDRIVHSIKSYTAHESNKVLERSGPFWATESYDHEIRTPEEYQRTIMYVLNNPVKARLVRDWRQWPWSWKR
jgi:REP element-mobilizing transposase RayT